MAKIEEFQHILKHYWGYNGFRPLQAEIIYSVASGRDTLALLPTGGGKSLCFQVPTMAMQGVCLVITPLIALMKDQVQNLRKRGIKATAIYTGMSNDEQQRAMAACQWGDYKFLYVSPERLESPMFLKRVTELPICLLAVDEAHCISQWGYDFRPAYLRIADIRAVLPKVPCLALTATATPDVVKDIQLRLGFKTENVYRKSFHRANLSYVVRHTENKEEQLLRILAGVAGTSIVYVRNRQSTRAIAEFLQAHDITAAYYHAGLSNHDKDEREQLWRSGAVRVMVATNAFGMGIDKPDVRTVIHMDLPDSIEAYFQEAGRAGRDEKRAYAVLLYNKDDRRKATKRVQDNYPDEDFIKRVYASACNYFEVVTGSGRGHTFALPFDDFCREMHLPILPTQSALQILSQAGYLRYTEETETNPRIRFMVTRDELYDAPMSALQERVVNHLLRTYAGLFADAVYIHDNQMSQTLNISKRLLNQILVELAQDGILLYIPRRKTPYLTFVQERVELSHMYLPPHVLQDRRGLYVHKISAMVQYAEQTDTCRSQYLLHYFGETNAPACGTCDFCVTK